MTTGMAILYLLGGVVVLTFGGDTLVRGACALAVRLRLTPAVIGLTVMAVGTSLPELFTSVVAQIRGSPDVSLGNIVGSNIFNIGAVLGLCGLLTPLPSHGNTVRLEWPFMFVSSWAFFLLSRDGTLDALEAGFFLVSFGLFTAYMVRLARIEVTRRESESFQEIVAETAGDGGRGPLILPLLQIIGGGGALWGGAYLLVEGASELAREVFPSERIVGLAIVGPGTGLPEFVATLVAALRGRTDMAIGNVVGSNICNILLIGGTAGSIGSMAVSPEIIASDMWWMLGISFVLGPLLMRNKISRWGASACLVIYVVYMVLLFVD